MTKEQANCIGLGLIGLTMALAFEVWIPTVEPYKSPWKPKDKKEASIAYLYAQGEQQQAGERYLRHD